MNAANDAYFIRTGSDMFIPALFSGYGFRGRFPDDRFRYNYAEEALKGIAFTYFRTRRLSSILK